MKILTCNEAINLLTQQMIEERVIPIFGAGFTKDCPALKGFVPDGKTANLQMKEIIMKYCEEIIPNEELENKEFNDTAKLFKQLNERNLLKNAYREYFQNNYTQVDIGKIKKDFLKMAWPYAMTLNVDDGIERTGEFRAILPYLDAHNKQQSGKVLYKLHGDAAFECTYGKKDSIVFDIDQYTRSLNDAHNQSFRECVCNTYRDFNMLFIGCSLQKEPDLKYLYNVIREDEKKTSRYVIRNTRPNALEEMELEEYGITHVICVDDYEQFYMDFINAYRDQEIEKKVKKYPFQNPKVILEDDENLKYFSGYRAFDEKANSFRKSKLIIKRDCVSEIQEKIEKNDIVLVVGRRFSGKSAVLCGICEEEVRRNVYYFPSTALESPDVIQMLLTQEENALFVFDTNALASDSYFFIRDSKELLEEKNNKIVLAANQSDNYLSEIIQCDEVTIKNYFSEDEIVLFKECAGAFGFKNRSETDTNLDYLELLYREQKIQALNVIHLPRSYTLNEKILLLILYVKDKVYTKDIYTLGIKQSELKYFLERTKTLVELVNTSRGESSNRSGQKLVHNSKIILLKEVRNFRSQDTLDAILSIVKGFLKGDSEQKRIYKEVMQFDTLNHLFGGKSGAGRLIFNVYKQLQPILKDDLHYWLQRAKSIYRLVPETHYFSLKEAYGYAKKVYMDSEQKSLTAKAALTTSLICCLLYQIERKPSEKSEYQREAISLGAEAIQSEYYRSQDRLNSELESSHRSYRFRLLETCQEFMKNNTDRELGRKAREIIHKLDKENKN